MKYMIICWLMAALSSTVVAQVPTPGKAIDGRVLIRYATAHIGNGEVIDNAYIEVQNGEISRVVDANSTRINEADYDRLIDVDGQHVYPGFIVMDSRLGLVEIGAVRATHDYDETGELNPNVQALPAFNTESKVISTVRTNGVLMAQIAPKGGGISGASSAVHFDGWNWQDARVKANEGIYLNWPARYRQSGWWAEPGAVKGNKNYQEELVAIHDYFKEAQAYAQLPSPNVTNLRFEGMKPLFTGEARLYVRADWARDILDVIQFARSLELKHVAIVGGAEARLVTTELRENGIPVIIDRVHKLPAHSDDLLSAPFSLAKDLVKEGIVVAFATSGSMEAMISRNLPFQVGTAIHYGLDKEEAVKALTLTPARLMGIDQRYGTLESGKVATFFISKGDAFDMSTNKVTHAFIEGKPIDLSNHQRELYEKYSRKHGIAP